MAKHLLTFFVLCYTISNSFALSCYLRNGSNPLSSASVNNCTVETTCYNYTTGGSIYYAGCGGCSSQQTLSYSCMNCTGNLCNALYIKCYFASFATDMDAVFPTDCFGSTSCYMFNTGAGMNFFAGCGNCDPYTSSNPSCSTCVRNLCNNFTMSSSTISSGIGLTGGLPKSASIIGVNSLLTVGLGALKLALLASEA